MTGPFVQQFNQLIVVVQDFVLISYLYTTQELFSTAVQCPSDTSLAQVEELRAGRGRDHECVDVRMKCT